MKDKCGAPATFYERVPEKAIQYFFLWHNCSMGKKDMCKNAVVTPPDPTRAGNNVDVSSKTLKPHQLSCKVLKERFNLGALSILWLVPLGEIYTQKLITQWFLFREGSKPLSKE